MSGIVSSLTLDPSLTDSVLFLTIIRLKQDIINTKAKLKDLFHCNWDYVQ
jgi:hypothetical protein